MPCHNDDGIGHYKGNFGNLLFVWDVLFGTAQITRRYPAKVGLPDDLLFGKESGAMRDVLPAVPVKARSLRAGGGRQAVRRVGGRSPAIGVLHLTRDERAAYPLPGTP